MTEPTEKPIEIGLYISRERRSYDKNDRIRVSVVRKSEDGQSTRGLSSTCAWRPGFPKRLKPYRLENLEMGGQVYESSDTGNEWIAFFPRYYSAYCIDLREAEEMAKTLRALNAAVKKWRAKNGDDVRPDNGFAIFAQFVGATFVAYRDNTNRSDMHRREGEQIMEVADGIRKYAREVEGLCANHVKEYA